MDDIANLKQTLVADIAAAQDQAALEAVRVSALGKKGQVTQLMKGLGGMSPEERKTAGPALNALKDEIAGLLDSAKQALEAAEMDVRLATERVDVSLTPRPERDGFIHPVSQVIDEITAVFGDMGFSVAEGPDIEQDFYNFTALNIPPEHPARQMHDTFYLNDQGDGAERMLLRTHTSPVQIRTMENNKPPYRIIAPGRTYRCDSDMTHTPMFHQVEGLVIDRDINMGHLKGCLAEFARSFFDVEDLGVRFRPSYFPFTEPSAELDIGCTREGNNLTIGGDDWLEILGCGMVHPKVLEHVGVDPNEWQGFAFGMGIDRIAMLKYGIPDLRAFFESDLRWLRHYGFSALDVPGLAGGLAR
ncbi:MAG: phenylalanine--tRNA ligase subunit alpha [Alphaproteobacteria bacterium]|jgi:phenylalanyl-tRNA synthetase alpha chain|nr:phenylalanine--tRNA ligase subunit alpha [Alphaproteobacteria bacterium]MBT4018056.1 phenylalanine--tRNA ligase subunit alpha [Alphaproteobacteria bacterium]MBT5160597.1 phenylalanine--tRNA ligase subunit alpha [Alphaproteobacteria bacterium]MBT6385031.1 phenylalanine--tRNA ligase subunit alpha [Alphaproteobacteria bacterium]